MKRFMIIGQVENGEKLEELTKHISKALKDFENEHGQLAEAEVQVVVAEQQVQPIFTDARSIGFHKEEDDEDFE